MSDSPAPCQEVADGIYCLETGLYHPGFAASYLVRSGDRLAFVDTGTANSAPALLDVVAALGLTTAHVDYVILTHVHLDHAGGAGHLMAACEQAQLVVHPKGAPHMIDPGKLIAGSIAVYGEENFLRDYGAPLPIPEARVVAAEDGQRFALNGRELTFLDTPGHANHHGCILDDRTRGLFAGDTFGLGYREFITADGPWLFAPTTPVAFAPETWLTSLDKLMAHDPQLVYLAHYGRLERPAERVEEVRRSIRDQAELALREEGAPEEGRQGRIRDAVSALLWQRVREHGVDLPDNRVDQLLAVDIELNAQGLEVWLKRRERRAAG
jgi:glyoxylase-like metal-dependent hydrolase (beta-lactamase superfamily II)